MSYPSEIKLGARYRDRLSGYEGVATAVEFNLTGCERVTLEALDGAELKGFVFDVTRLEYLAGPADVVADINRRVLANAPGGPVVRKGLRARTRR